MVPLYTLFCPLAAIGITGLYTAWNRTRLCQVRGADHELRARVAYMLWVAANKA
jgi:hypothetical protein